VPHVPFVDGPDSELACARSAAPARLRCGAVALFIFPSDVGAQTLQGFRRERRVCAAVVKSALVDQALAVDARGEHLQRRPAARMMSWGLRPRRAQRAVTEHYDAVAVADHQWAPTLAQLGTQAQPRRSLVPNCMRLRAHARAPTISGRVRTGSRATARARRCGEQVRRSMGARSRPGAGRPPARACTGMPRRLTPSFENCRGRISAKCFTKPRRGLDANSPPVMARDPRGRS